MSNVCDCLSVFKNSGQPSCVGTLPAVPKKLIMVAKYKADGTLNKISLPATLNQAYFDALVNNVDRTQRWYPLPEMKSVELTKAETVYETFPDGSKKFVNEGVRSFKAVLPAISPNYAGVIKSGNCNEMAVYMVDKNGTLHGVQVDGEKALYPYPLNQNTMDAMYMWATDTTGSNLSLSFEFDTELKDEDFAWITSKDMVYVNLLNLTGLYDAYVEYTTTGQTSMTFKLFAKTGNVASAVAITGLVITDFALYNVTDSAAVTILTAVESPSGTYTLTYASQTVSDVIRLTPTKAKIDFANVVASTSVVV